MLLGTVETGVPFDVHREKDRSWGLREPVFGTG